jgi:peptide/nickel transport system substrate-binding protein
VDAANKALEDAGWVDTNGDGIREKNGKNLVIDHYYRSDDPVTSVIAPFLKDNFTKIGIDFELHGGVGTGYFDAVRSGKHNTQMWWETLTDPDMLIRPVLYSAFIHGGTNRNNLVDHDLDAMLDKAAGEPDQAKRAELYHEILKSVEDKAYMVTLINQEILYANTDKLTGVIYYMSGTYPYFAPSSFTQ